MANQWEDEILATKWGDKILAYKRGDEITTNTWRDKINVPTHGGTRSSHLGCLGDKIMANKWEDEILATKWGDKILAYKWGDKISTDTWRDKILTDKWEDQALTYRPGGKINVPTHGGKRSSHLEEGETDPKMLPRTMLPQTWTMIP